MRIIEKKIEEAIKIPVALNDVIGIAEIGIDYEEKLVTLETNKFKFQIGLIDFSRIGKSIKI